MKVFWKYIFPACFGMIVYTSIRLVNDSMSGEIFWERSFRQNFIEILFVIIMAYMFEFALRYFIQQFNKRKDQYNIQNILKEFSELCLASIIFINPFLYLIHYLIHDPVKFSDIVIANILFILYVLLYYAIVRGNNLIKSYI